MSHVDGWRQTPSGSFHKGAASIYDLSGQFELFVDSVLIGAYSCLEMAMEDAYTTLDVMEEICDGS